MFLQIQGNSNDCQNYNINYEPRRSEENSNDTATTSSVINEVLSYKNISISKFKYVCCIYPTAPLINIKDLRKAQKILEKSNVDSVVPIIQFEYPIQRALNIKKNGLLSFLNLRMKILEVKILKKNIMTQVNLFSKPNHFKNIINYLCQKLQV